jgi:hypothetical protein
MNNFTNQFEAVFPSQSSVYICYHHQTGLLPVVCSHSIVEDNGNNALRQFTSTNQQDRGPLEAGY